MDIEVVFVLQVVRPELSEAVLQNHKSDKRRRPPHWLQVDILSFIPRNDVGYSNLVETSEEGECGKQDGSDHPLPFFEGLEDGGL